MDSLRFLKLLIKTVVNDTQRKADKKNLTVHYEQIDTLPGRIFGDSRMLNQVLLHLLDNAVKFTDHGKVTLRASVVQSPCPHKSGLKGGPGSLFTVELDLGTTEGTKKVKGQ